jgi:hypothetical protein
VLLLGLVAVGAMLVFTLRPASAGKALGQPASTQQAGLELAIDADAENGKGPCDPIDDEAFVETGATHRIAVCAVNPPEPPFAFYTLVVYDGQLNVAPDVVPCTSPALDCNPDANAGATTFSTPNLGEGWDCTGLGVLSPTGDDPYTPDQHDAVMACNANLVNPDTTLVDGGPLEVITFTAIGQGDDSITFDPRTHVGGNIGGKSVIMGRCGTSRIPEETVPCRGAVIHKGQKSRPATAPAGASPGAPTPSGAQSAVATGEAATAPAAQTTSQAGHGEGFPWAVLGGSLAGLSILTAALGGLYVWRRATRGRT